MKNFVLCFFVLLLIQVFQNISFAEWSAADEEASRISAKDLVFMPPFCRTLPEYYFQKDAISLRRPDMKKPPGVHNHHLCAAMKDFGRGNYDEAIKNFNYVQENYGDPKNLTPDYYPLLAATSLYKAEALVKLGRQGALQEYRKAIQIKPKYPKAYTKLADYYISLGMKNEALDIIKAGLKYSPHSNALNKRLQQLQPH